MKRDHDSAPEQICSDISVPAAERFNALLNAMLLVSGKSRLHLPTPIFLPPGGDPFGRLTSREYVIYPISAVVAVSVLTTDGGMSGAALVGWDGSFGMASSPETSFSYFYHTVQAGYAACVPVAQVLEILKSTDASGVLLEYLGFVIKEISTNPYCAARHSVESRVARWIIAVCLRSPLRDINVTHEFLGNYLCMRRESVTEALGRLVASGVIQTERGRIVVANPRALAEKACVCSYTDKAWLSRWKALAYRPDGARP